MPWVIEGQPLDGLVLQLLVGKGLCQSGHLLLLLGSESFGVYLNGHLSGSLRGSVKKSAMLA